MKKPYVIGISGGSGSGKTCFINDLKEAFGPDSLCVISQDEYYRAREDQKTDEKGIKNFDLPYSIDHQQFLDDLEKVINGNAVSRKEYTFNNAEKEASEITYLPAPIIVIEGLFIFHFEEIMSLLDLKLFIQAKENLKVIRRIKRDGVERNYPLDDVLYRYEHHVLPSFEKFIEPYKTEVDIIINNNESYQKGLDVIKGFIHSRLL